MGHGRPEIDRRGAQPGVEGPERAAATVLPVGGGVVVAGEPVVPGGDPNLDGLHAIGHRPPIGTDADVGGETGIAGPLEVRLAEHLAAVAAAERPVLDQDVGRRAVGDPDDVAAPAGGAEHPVPADDRLVETVGVSGRGEREGRVDGHGDRLAGRPQAAAPAELVVGDRAGAGGRDGQSQRGQDQERDDPPPGRETAPGTVHTPS